MKFLIFNIIFALFYTIIDYLFNLTGIQKGNIEEDLIYIFLNMFITSFLTYYSMFKLKYYLD